MKVHVDSKHLNNLKLNRKEKRLQQKRNSYKKREAEMNKTLSKWASYKRNERQKKKEIKEIAKVRQKKYRQTKCEKALLNLNRKNIYKNRMEKSRIMNKLSQCLPGSPVKRNAVVQDFVKLNCGDHTIHNSNSPVASAEKTAISNIKEFIESTKLKRSDDSRRVMNIVSASISNENLEEKSKVSLAQKFGIKPSRLSGGQRIRTSILKSEKSCYNLISRKTRSDSITEENKRVVYDFWLSPEISRVTGNKNDIKRQRVGPKVYASHTIQILEKSQTEAFLDFKTKYNDIKISQRTFESLKPFYVIPMRKKDRCTCCCRTCVETKMLFITCMSFRKLVLKDKSLSEDDCVKYRTYEHLQELVKSTLCNEGEHEIKNIKCLKRECTECGIHLLNLLPEENNETGETCVKWERYEYVSINLKGGKTRRKLQLVERNTQPGLMFSYFFSLVKQFPSHQFRAKWQNKQYKNITSNLPENTAVVVHDFSENYRCIERNELQSSYFQKTEISIHVSILHRRAVLEFDQSEESETVAEQFIVISDDLQHDRHFVAHVQTLISEYLNSIPLQVDNMIEFTDGCSSQYKSKNCMGDVSSLCPKLNYKTLSRNYYETSHAKGPQDAAGGFLKKQADLAVLRKCCNIQTASDLFTFADTNLKNPKRGVYKRRIFRHVTCIPRQSIILEYKPVNENRKIHHILATQDLNDVLSISELSCYECENCLLCDSAECENSQYLGCRGKVKMYKTKERSKSVEENEIESENNISTLISNRNVVAVLADDNEYDYFLLKVLDTPCHLQNNETDDWGNTFLSGASVVKGEYYERKGRSPFKYQLIKNKIAIVYSVAVRYICDLRGNINITVTERLHEDIIESLDC